MGTEPRRSRGWCSASPQPGPRGCSRNAQEGPQPLSIHRLRSRLQSSSGKVRLKKNNKQPSGKPRARVKTFSAGGCPQHPQSDAIPLPQQSALLYYRFAKVSLSNSYSFERSSCSPSSPLCSKFSCVLCWWFVVFFLQQAYLLIFLTGQSNTFRTCGDLHLQDPRGSLPSPVKQEGGLGDRKMHDSFKLLLLSPSRTQVRASTQKALLLFVSY